MSDRSSAADAAFAADSAQKGGSSPIGPADREVARPAAPGDPPPSPGPPPLPVAAAVGPTPLPAAPPLETEPSAIEIGGEDASDWREWWVHLPSWLASMVAHLSLVLLLALLTTLTAQRGIAPRLVVSTDENFDEGEPEQLRASLMETSDELPEEQALVPAPLADLPPATLDAGPIRPILPGGDLKLARGEADLDNLLAGAGNNSLQWRQSSAMHDELLRSGGGTPESEEAVLRALAWLAEHQYYDGSWSFQHHKHPKCHGSCDDPGYNAGRIAATGLALLPFLGAGQTQFEGPHKRTIEQGLKYLVRSLKTQGDLGSLWDPHGTMYGHGLATIALCEAYGMTHEAKLRKPAQSAVNFIVDAQDRVGGGWRYHPQNPGDTSVVGWQVMALKSAQMAYLRVPQQTFRQAGYFLDSVQGQRGAVYGYQRPDSRRPSTTAIGLLCRMYLGWQREVRPLRQGVHTLSLLGPSTDKSGMRNNMYYNFYATQVMHHWGGESWDQWNTAMRDYLIETQAQRGHEIGSWYFNGADLGAGGGGRLYFTALAAMTLEVYYRHMPLYREQSVRD